MVYFGGSKDGKKFVYMAVISTENLEELKKGRPLVTPDGRFVVAWTPDLGFVSDEIVALIRNSPESVDMATAAGIVDADRSRPEKPFA